MVVQGAMGQRDIMMFGGVHVACETHAGSVTDKRQQGPLDTSAPDKAPARIEGEARDGSRGEAGAEGGGADHRGIGAGGACGRA